MKLSLRFYRTDAGDEPVRDWLRTLSKEDRQKIGIDMMTVQAGWPVGMPVCRALGGGLFEVRTALDRRISRVLFCFHGESTVVVLHGFIKKTQRTPASDLELARKRRASLRK